MTPDERQAWMRVTAYLRTSFKGVPASASLRLVEDLARAAFEHERVANKGTIAQAEQSAMNFVRQEIARLQGERDAGQT